MTAHRYWRLFIADNFEPSGANRYYTSLIELEMFTTVGGSNVCTGGTPIASSDHTLSGWSKNNAFDGVKNNDVGWAADNVPPPAWIGYDFGAGNEKDILQYSFTVRSSAGSMTQSPRIFTLQYSDDGIEWFSSDGTVIKSTLWNANESLTRTTSMHFSATKRFTRVVRQFDSSTASISAAQNCFKGDSDISGTIRVEGDEVENAVVHLKDATTGLHLRSTLTNVLGDYEFKNLRRDRIYDVVAEDPLKEWEKVVSSRRTPLFEFKMRPKVKVGEFASLRRLIGDDPYWSETVSLLRFNGDDASTTIVDECGTMGWVAHNGSTISTTKSKYGGASGKNTGANQRFYSPADNKFVIGERDFTIECWVNPEADPGDMWGRIIQFGANSTNGGLWVVRKLTSNPATIIVDVHSSGYITILDSGAVSLPAEQWSHVAVTRQSHVWRLFINGIKVSESNFVNYLSANYFMYGANNTSGEVFKAYFDDARLTIGAARYVGDFTPPSSQMATN